VKDRRKQYTQRITISVLERLTNEKDACKVKRASEIRPQPL